MTTKSLFYPLLAVCLLLVLNACDDTLDNLGSDVIGSEFVVGADTLYMKPFQLGTEAMYYNQDTLLLGEYFDSRYGTVKAEVLAEVLSMDTVALTKKIGDSIRWENPQYDELVLVANQFVEKGSNNSPLKVSIYQKSDTLVAKEKYYTNIKVTDYVDSNKLLGEFWLTGETDFRVKLKDELGEYLFKLPSSDFKDHSKFREAFKGLYITTSSGKDLLLNLLDENYGDYFYLRLIYHYNDYTELKPLKVTPSPTRKDSIAFRALSTYPKAQKITNTIDLNKLKEKDDYKYNYVTSPAGLRSYITIDLPHIKQRLGMNDRDINISKAELSLKVKPDTETTLPMPKYLMLIQKDSVIKFFEKGKYYDGRTSFVATRDTVTNKYVFDIAPYIQKKKNDGKMDDLDDLLVVPISYNSSYIKEKIGLSALRFYKDSVQVDIIYNHLKTKD